MKKLISLVLLLALLVSATVSCGADVITTGSETTTVVTTTDATTTVVTTMDAVTTAPDFAPIEPGDAPTTPVDPSVTTTATTTEAQPDVDTPELPAGERIVTHSYTAVLNDEEWSSPTAEGTNYKLFGTGSEIYQKAKAEYSGYTLSFVVEENG